MKFLLTQKFQKSMDLPTIENVVSTAMLLPKGGFYQLPLDALSRQLKCSQYAPVQFAANIIKISDSITDSTVLIFASGKIVVVASLTLQHTRYVSQLVRFIVEQVNCMVRDDAGRVYESNLMGRTVFEDCRIHNIVGSGNLNCKIDLQAMCDAAPLACKWFPDWFPGLKCKVWLTESHSCECASSSLAQAREEEIKNNASPLPRPKGGAQSMELPPQAGEDDILPLILGKQKKCSCAVKLLVFDSGRIVITGARSIENVNNVYFRIKRLIVHFTKDGSNGVQNRLHVKNELKTLLVKTTNQVSTAVVAALQEEPKQKRAKTSAASAENQPPLLKFALAGRIKDIQTLLQFDKDPVVVKQTLHHLQQLTEKSSVMDEIIELLKIYHE